MKILFVTILACISFCAVAQEKVVKYYNADFAEVAKERSMYYYEFVKEGDGYNCTGYYTRTNTIQCKAFYSDSMIGAPSGLQTVYYKNGKLQDSIFYTPNGAITEAFHFIESGQLEAHFYTQPNQNGPITDAYDPTGKKIKGYIYGKEAQFKGGEKAWHAYLLKNLRTDITNKVNQEALVKLEVQFIIDPSGFVNSVKIKKTSGIKEVDRDAIQVISASPQWINAIQYNKPVRAYIIQPLTYSLIVGKK